MQGVSFRCLEQALKNKEITLSAHGTDLSALDSIERGEFLVLAPLNANLSKIVAKTGLSTTLKDAYASNDNIRMDGTEYYTRLKYDKCVKGKHHYCVDSFIFRYTP
jgi:hypothetical protein